MGIVQVNRYFVMWQIRDGKFAVCKLFGASSKDVVLAILLRNVQSDECLLHVPSVEAHIDNMERPTVMFERTTKCTLVKFLLLYVIEGRKEQNREGIVWIHQLCTRMKRRGFCVHLANVQRVLVPFRYANQGQFSHDDNPPRSVCVHRRGRETRHKENNPRLAMVTFHQSNEIKDSQLEPQRRGQHRELHVLKRTPNSASLE